MEQGFVGRQPICRAGAEVFAYELFTQNNELNQADFVSGDTGTLDTVLNELVDVGLDGVIGPHPAFIDVSRDFVISGRCSALPKNAVVLQTAASEPADDMLLGALSQLSEQGYSIALKDFLYSDAHRPMIELADIVKLNVRKHDRQTVSQQVEALGSCNVKLLAEEVDTRADYDYCKKLGFDYFEGYFFCEPQISSKEPLPFNRLSTLHLLSKLQDPEISLKELEQAVGQDVAMSFRILRYLNSPIHALTRRVESIRHAITLVGTNLIRQWASVIWLESIEDKPRELMVMSMVRAQMCQQLGTAMGCKNLDQFFTVGLLSLLDVLLDRPMATVLDELPLVDEVKEALLNRKGPMGSALNCIRAYERCDWDSTSCTNLDGKKIREAYLGSLSWSRTVVRELVN